MVNNSINSKRALILFIKDENRPNRKRFNNSLTYKLLNQQIRNVVKEVKKMIHFDIILCSDKPSIIESDYYIKQSGKNFGERFNNAITKTFDHGYDELIIIGNDSPDLSANHIIESFNNISKNVVIGPSSDGGIYLLGLSKNMYERPIKARWNTSHVLKDVSSNFNSMDIFQLETLKDIDSESDLYNWLLLKSIVSGIFMEFLKNALSELKKHVNKIDLLATEQNIYRQHTQKAPPFFISY